MFRPALLKRLAFTCLVLAALTFLLGAWYASRAQLVQLVRPETAATTELFGDDSSASSESSASGDSSAPAGSAGVPGTAIGSPQRLIIRSQAAFLPEQGQGGLRYVSEPKLKELGEYPLQQKTVLFFRNAVTLGFLAAAALLALLSAWVARRQTPHSVTRTAP